MTKHRRSPTVQARRCSPLLHHANPLRAHRYRLALPHRGHRQPSHRSADIGTPATQLGAAPQPCPSVGRSPCWDRVVTGVKPDLRSENSSAPDGVWSRVFSRTRVARPHPARRRRPHPARRWRPSFHRKTVPTESPSAYGRASGVLGPVVGLTLDAAGLAAAGFAALPSLASANLSFSV